jgi:hypothetical protein
LKRVALITSLTAIAALPASAQAKTYYLDTYDAGSKAYTTPLVTEKLAKGIPYRIVVRGSFSLFGAAEYKGEFCGTSDPRPVYATKKQPNGPVSADAEFLFGDISRNCSRRTSVVTASSFQIKTNTSYVNRQPIGLAQLTGPKTNHLYTYPVIGVGKVARFRLLDDFTKDNYGRLKITISRMQASSCTKGGFANWKYADEATCVAAAQKKIPKAKKKIPKARKK